MDAVPSLHVHPTDQTLDAYGLGKLEDLAANAVNEHLEACAECRSRVASMTADSFLNRMRDAQGPLGVSTIGRSQLGGMSLDGRPNIPPPTETLPPGLADHPDYEVKKELGRGGMGVVYLAHNRLMGRDEVLKVMGRRIMERPQVLERFTREIRAVARLRHPNIVTAYSASRLGDGIVFAMEYVEGLDLSRMVKAKGSLPVAHACHFIHQAALGLQHAHEEGLVHRDIKPANLMLSRRGDKAIVKVLDFGLAKAVLSEKLDTGLTHEGQALGTPDFIAPEQILDAPSADIRADIYSLGGTLFYLLTGRPPFQANSLYDIYQAHISREIDPINLIRPEVPAELAALVAKMMAKEPRRRFQTPAEVAEALKLFFKGGATKAKPEISQFAGSVVEPPTHSMISTPRPATIASAPIRSEPQWESLISIPESEPLSIAPVVSAKRRPPWIWPAVAAGVLFFGMIAAWMAIDVLRVKTEHGDLVFSDLPEHAVVSVDGSVVTVEWPGGKGAAKVSIPAGEHKVKVKWEGAEIAGEEVKIAAGEEKWIKIRVEARIAKRSTTQSVPRAVEMPEAITDSIGMKLKLIQPGEFLMGASDDPGNEHRYMERAENASPRHKVGITRPFYLGVHEVTQHNYQKCMGYNPSKHKDTSELPVDSVSWFDAIQFCNDISKIEGVVPYYKIEGEKVTASGGNGYRLPTEAEWEYACRGGSQTLYAHGNDGMRMEAYAWVRSNSDMKTHPVGEKRPNGFGLYDMSGNVAEWCWDWLAPYASDPGIAKDPAGPVSGTHRVVRGGHIFNGTLLYCAPWDRAWEQDIHSHEATIGFRVARNTTGGSGPAGGMDKPDLSRSADGMGSMPISAREKSGVLTRRPAVPPAPNPPVAKLSTQEELVAALELQIPMRFPRGTSLGELVEYIRKETKGPNYAGVPIFVDPFGLREAEKSMASVVTIDISGRPLKQTLRMALKELGLDYRTSEGLLNISNAGKGPNAGFAAGRIEVKADRNAESKMVLEALEQPIPMRYPEKARLGQVVDAIRAALKDKSGSPVPIQVVEDGLREAEKTLDSEVSIDVEGIPLRVTLHWLLHQIGMNYYVKGGVLTITDRGSIPREL